MGENRYLGSPGGSDSKESACNTGHTGLIPESEDSLRKEMATHFSILAWRIPGTQETGGLYSPWVTKSWTQLSD